MMFGTRDAFHYFACADCGCVQLVDPPSNLSSYYPAAYHSFSAPVERTGMRRWLRRLRNRGTFAPRHAIDRTLARIFPYPVAGASDWMQRAGATRTSRILDVGCGTGAILLDLASAGYMSLLGIDPFVAADINYENGVRIQQTTIHEVTGTFDVIMLHHSFEHVTDPFDTLRSVAARLAPGGCCLIRIPTASSWAWEHYRENWVQLDAPRHYYLHSIGSFAALASSAALRVNAVVYDSTEFQFMGSELYCHDQPLAALPSSYSSAQRRNFRVRARELNAEGRGDQAAFYLRKA